MNAKFPAKRPLAVMLTVAVTAMASAFGAAADDGNLTQQVRIEQSKSAFQLELEQIEARARARAAAASEGAGERPEPVDLGDSAESLRLEPVDPGDPPPSTGEPESMRRLQAEQAYDRDQQRILEQRQQRRALRSESPVVRSNRIDAYARDRGERVRFQSESKQQSFQRKLRP